MPAAVRSAMSSMSAHVSLLLMSGTIGRRPSRSASRDASSAIASTQSQANSRRRWRGLARPPEISPRAQSWPCASQPTALRLPLVSCRRFSRSAAVAPAAFSSLPSALPRDTDRRPRRCRPWSAIWTSSVFQLATTGSPWVDRLGEIGAVRDVGDEHAAADIERHLDVAALVLGRLDHARRSS